jgi:hypothetical protein
MLKLFFILSFYFLSILGCAQNFNRENTPKLFFMELGLGAGSILPKPRPNTFSVDSKILPSLNLGLGKRLSNYFSIKSNFNFQPFNASALTFDELANPSFGDLLTGKMVGMDFTPFLNLFPINHHLTRSNINLSIGIGIGFAVLNTKEKVIFQNQNYKFNFLSHSAYIPLRISSEYRLNYLEDLSLEGAFFKTNLNSDKKLINLNSNSDNLLRLSITYRRYIR